MQINDLWMTHYSVDSWMSATNWNSYLRELEEIVEDTLVKLDDNDPIRRKASTKSGEGDFIVGFGPREDSRSIFGRFEKTKIEIEITNYKSGKDSFGRLRENRLKIFIPEHLVNTRSTEISKVFRLGMRNWGVLCLRRLEE